MLLSYGAQVDFGSRLLMLSRSLFNCFVRHLCKLSQNLQDISCHREHRFGFYLLYIYFLTGLTLGCLGFRRKECDYSFLESPPVLLLPLLSPWLTAEGMLRAQIPISLLIAVVSHGEHHTCFLFFSLLCCILVPNHFIGSGGDARIFTESG